MRIGSSFTISVRFTADTIVVVVMACTVVVSVFVVVVISVDVAVTIFVSTTVVSFPVFDVLDFVEVVDLDEIVVGPVVDVLLVVTAGCVTGPTVVVPVVGAVSDVVVAVFVDVFDVVTGGFHFVVGPTCVTVVGLELVVVFVVLLMTFAAPVDVVHPFWHHMPLSSGMPL